MARFDEETGESFSSIYFTKGRTALEAGDAATALRLLEASQQELPHHKTMLLMSQALAELGEKEGSFSALSEAYRLNPRHSQIAVAYAEALVARGERDRAVEILRSALRSNRTYRPAQRMLDRLGSTELDQGKR